MSSIQKYRSIVKEIDLLSNDEKIEVFKILDKNNVKYTENSNGIYIIFSKVSDGILNEIRKFLDFCKLNHEKLETQENDLLTQKQKFFGDNEELDVDDNQFSSPTDNRYYAEISNQNELDKYGLNLSDVEKDDLDINLKKEKPKYSSIQAKIIKSN